MTIIDKFTRWPEAFLLKDISAKSVANTFFKEYVTRFGVPQKITSDQGTQFTSAIIKELVKFLGAHKIMTTPYHPQSNGMVERLHRQTQTEASLTARNNSINWSEELPIVLMGLSNC